jgi:hypothetical protein
MQSSKQQQNKASSEEACFSAERFWQGFAQSLAVVCAADVSYGLMGASCLTPGVITLLSNLVRSLDASSLPAAELAALPHWVRQYLAGAGHELYEVPLLPQHMNGHRVALITKWVKGGGGSKVGAVARLAATASSGLQCCSGTKM